MDLSDKEKAEIVKLYYSGNSIRQVRDFWAGMYPNRRIPSKSFISKVITNFERTGKFTSATRGGNRRNGETTEINVLALVSQNPELSAAMISQTVGICKANVLRILHKHKFKSYKIQRHQELLPRDAEARNAFAERMFNLANNDLNFLKKFASAMKALTLFMVNQTGRIQESGQMRILTSFCKQECSGHKKSMCGWES